MTTQERIVIGHLTEPYGIKGWLHLLSNANPPENIFNYKTWQVQQNNQFITLPLESYKPHGNHFVIKIKNCDDRDQALYFKNKNIFIDRAELPELQNNQYYWSDLIGLAVVNKQNQSLGTIDYLFETGSNDVIATTTRQFIPYLNHVILSVNLEKKIMLVDWELITL